MYWQPMQTKNNKQIDQYEYAVKYQFVRGAQSF